LVKHVQSLVSEFKFENYHEPFLGGAAVYFSLSVPGKKYLSDINQELIETYTSLRDEKEAVISVLKTFSNDKEAYYQVRSSTYSDSASRAARFIFLNQTSFNGIYRVNAKGEYNVPFGNRSTRFLDIDRLSKSSEALQGAIIKCGDFTVFEESVSAGDLVFLDPPYTVSHNNNSFIKYNQKLFSLDDQIRLQQFIKRIKIKGAYYILSNAAHPKIKEIFNSSDTLVTLERASLIGGKKASRGMVDEYLFTNIGG
jgi:DNA adenine methylase